MTKKIVIMFEITDDHFADITNELGIIHKNNAPVWANVLATETTKNHNAWVFHHIYDVEKILDKYELYPDLIEEEYNDNLSNN